MWLHTRTNPHNVRVCNAVKRKPAFAGTTLRRMPLSAPLSVPLPLSPSRNFEKSDPLAPLQHLEDCLALLSAVEIAATVAFALSGL